MERMMAVLVSFAAVGFLLFGLSVPAADAQRRSEREVRDIVRSLNSKIDDLRTAVEFQSRNNAADELEDVEADILELQENLNAFQENLNQRRENREDVSNVLAVAANIDGFFAENPPNRRLAADWLAIRDLLDRLAGSYGVTANWGRGGGAPASRAPSRPQAVNRSGHPLAGTYELDSAKSEIVADIIAGKSVGAAQKRDLEGKLEAPRQIAIDIRGQDVTLATSAGSPVTFAADGRERTETSGGRTVRVKATLKQDQLVISSVGGETDYTVTFASADNGRTLKVTRRITTDYLDETLFADSVYDRTDNFADDRAAAPDDDAYSSSDPADRGVSDGAPSATLPRIGEHIVPNGTIISAVLDNEIDTKVSQNNDRFRMTVQSPDEYRGAVIEGYISGVGRSGQVSGRPNVTFNFMRITMRDGTAYDFAGFLQGVKDVNGKTVKVDTEGAAKGDSQTKETAVRGGVGAGVGAVIGAIAGGAKGAALGAIIGGGAGAGSVVAQGRDDLRLQKGSTVTIQASSPLRPPREQAKD